MNNFRDDPLFPRIERAVAIILTRSKVVTPVEVLVGMDMLIERDLKDWSEGKIPYLETVIAGNLTRLSRLLRILRYYAHDLNLVPATGFYPCKGNVPRRLRFTKTGEPKIEDSYARHFVWPGKGSFHYPEECLEELTDNQALNFHGVKTFI